MKYSKIRNILKILLYFIVAPVFFGFLGYFLSCIQIKSKSLMDEIAFNEKNVCVMTNPRIVTNKFVRTYGQLFCGPLIRYYVRYSGKKALSHDVCYIEKECSEHEYHNIKINH